MVAVSDLKAFSEIMDQGRMLRKKYPNWLVREKNKLIYGFKNVYGIIDETKPETKENLFPIAVRVSLHGVFFFSKKENPDIYHLTKGDYISLEDLKGLKTKGVYPIQVGGAYEDGFIWFSDCVYEPGITEKGYLEMRAFFQDIIKPYTKMIQDKKRKLSK